MLKKAIVVFLVYSIFIQGETGLGTIAYFQLNKDYISKVLCINKDKPVIHCNGKCYLSERMKNQKEEEIPVNTKETSNLCYSIFSANVPLPPENPHLNPNSEYLQSFYSVDLFSIFHPPLG